MEEENVNQTEVTPEVTVNETEPVEPDLQPIVVVQPVKATDAFEAHTKKLDAIFAEAYDRVLSELKGDIAVPGNYPVFIVRAMQAVADADIHGDEKKQIVIDIVNKLVENMPISDAERARVKATNYMLTNNLIDLMIGAAKGYLYLKTKVEEAVESSACSGCFSRTTAVPTAEATRSTPTVVNAHFDANVLVDEVYNIVKRMTRNKQISLINIVTFGTMVMQVVEEYPQLAGYQKKQLVLRVLHNLIDEDTAMDATERATLKLAIDTTVSLSIDFLVKVANGEIVLINKIVEAIERKCGSCCGTEAPARGRKRRAAKQRRR